MSSLYGESNDKNEGDDNDGGATDDENDGVFLELVNKRGDFDLVWLGSVGLRSWVVEGDRWRGFLFGGISGSVGVGWSGGGSGEVGSGSSASVQ